MAPSVGMPASEDRAPSRRPGKSKKDRQQSAATPCNQVVSGPSVASDAALRCTQLAAARQQGDCHTLDQTGQLQAQLLVFTADRQRLQQDYDDLSTNHHALISHCTELEQLLEASQAAECSSRAAAAAADKQVEELQQQLAEANLYLILQQIENKKQVKQLQQALGATLGGHMLVMCGLVTQLSAAFGHNKIAQAAAEAQSAAVQEQLTALEAQHQQLQQDTMHMQQLLMDALEATAVAEERHRKQQQQLADMAEAVAAAESARRAAQRDEAAVLQAMAHLAQQRAMDQRDMGQLKEQLAVAKKSVKRAEGIAAFLRMGLQEEREWLHDMVKAAEVKVYQAEHKVVRMQAATQQLREKWDALWGNMEASWTRMSGQWQEQLQQAAADKAQLAGQVARLRRLLELGGDAGCSCPTLLLSADTSKCQGARRNGFGLKWLWQTVRPR